MRVRRGLIAIGVGLAVVGTALAAVPVFWPGVVRHVAIQRLQAALERPVEIDRLDVRWLPLRLSAQGVRVGERAGDPRLTAPGQAAFAEAERLDLGVRILPLLIGRVHLSEITLRRPVVRVIRLEGGVFNISDLGQGESSGGPIDLTVDRFTIDDGTVSMEDRALPEPRTWVSERIAIAARNLSTRRDDGTATGTSITGGAPVAVAIERLRLYPIHLHGSVSVEGLDLSAARLYLPPDSPISVARGRGTTRVRVVVDAREGVRVDAESRIEDLALTRVGAAEPVAVAPRLDLAVEGFTAREGSGLGLARLDLSGAASLRDPRLPGRRVEFAALGARVAGLTWPLSADAAVEVWTGPSRAGSLAASATLRPAPAPSAVRVRVAGLDLAPWAQLLPVAARLGGVAEADLALSEPLAARVPAHLRGTLAVRRPSVSDGARTLLSAERIAATGLTVDWPTRLAVDRITLDQPRALVERDREGGFPLTALWRRPDGAPAAASGPAAGDAAAPTSVARPAGAARETPAVRGADARETPAVGVGAIVVRGGAVEWRDAAVSPPARLTASAIDAAVRELAWPLPRAIPFQLATATPGGGSLRVDGRVTLDGPAGEARPALEARVVARGAELAPYQPYVPSRARVLGRADLDLAVSVPADRAHVKARGAAALDALDLRDDQRTVLRIEHAATTGLNVDWPGRITVDRIALRRPWILVERGAQGELALRPLLTPRPPARAPAPEQTAAERPPAGAPSAGAATDEPAPLVMTIAEVTIDEGGLRMVDRAISPAFALDMHALGLRATGLSTGPARPARIELTGRLPQNGDLALRGTIGHLRGPLAVDLEGTIRQFPVVQSNPYLAHHVAWIAREGRLTTAVRGKVRGDALDARGDVRLSRFDVVRAGAEDGSSARFGLPLGMVVGLLKDRSGDIALSFPVTGKLGDPRFDFSEAIWAAVRTVAVKAITLPVSWIGRVRVDADSRIEDVRVDPIRFEPGTDVLAAEGQEQATRVGAFLRELPEMRLAAQPVVTARDLDAIRQRSLDAALQKAARPGESADAAAARLFAARFPDQRAPEPTAGMRAALLESEPVPPTAAAELAEKRLDRVRAAVKRLGIDPDRLPAREPAAEAAREAPEGIALALVEPAGPRPPGLIDRLRGVGQKLFGPGKGAR